MRRARGYAAQQPARELHLRVAGHNGKVYIDTADAKDRVIEISGGAWDYVNGAVPVMFRRSSQTAPMPEPLHGGKLNKLWEYVRIAKADRPILVAVLVSALIQPDAPHVILFVHRRTRLRQNSSVRYVVSLIDPAVAPTAEASAGRRLLGHHGQRLVCGRAGQSVQHRRLALRCPLSGGDRRGTTKRRLYTDADLTVLRFRRVIILNGIDLGGLREDLTDRLAPVDLERITDTDRKAESALATAWEQDRPAILGGLLDLAAQVHAKLPGFPMSTLPRMADFARVLGCVDDIAGTKGLEQYQQRAKHLAADGLAADPFIAQMMEIRHKCTDATAAEILAAVKPFAFLPRSWPQKPRTVTTRLTRAAPALRTLGWTIENDNAQNKANATLWTIKPPPPCQPAR